MNIIPVGLVNAGMGASVLTSEIQALATPKSAPLRRLVKAKKEQGMVVDFTYGHRVKTVIIATNGMIYLSAVNLRTLEERIRSELSRFVAKEVKGEQSETKGS